MFRGILLVVVFLVVCAAVVVVLVDPVHEGVDELCPSILGQTRLVQQERRNLSCPAAERARTCCRAALSSSRYNTARAVPAIRVTASSALS